RRRASSRTRGGAPRPVRSIGPPRSARRADDRGSGAKRDDSRRTPGRGAFVSTSGAGSPARSIRLTPSGAGHRIAGNDPGLEAPGCRLSRTNRRAYADPVSVRGRRQGDREPVKKYNTIIFVPHARARFRQLTISTRRLAVAAAAIGVVFIAA